MPRIALLVLSSLGASTSIHAGVRLSEVMYHPPLEALEFVEIANDGDQVVELSGWQFIDGIVFEFPAGSEIAGGEHIVICRDPEAFGAVYEVTGQLFGPYAGALANGGERVALAAPGDEVADALIYDDRAPFDPRADGAGRSLERVCLAQDAAVVGNWRASLVDGGTPFAAGESVCPPPLPESGSPVVVTEIHYHPSGEADPAGEFLELYNRDVAAVDLAGWRLSGAVEYRFTPGDAPTSIAPGEFLLVARHPGELAAATGIDALAIAGPYEGVLSNYRDDVELRDADDRVVDFIEYRQDGVWPALADGLGASLQRVDADVSGSLPQNWAVSHDCRREETCVLVENGTIVSWFENLDGSDPGFIGDSAWYATDFDADLNGWNRGPFAVGYDTRDPDGQPWILTSSTAEAGLHSILLRIEFDYDPAVDCGAQIPVLAADWDDGFIAWLNGDEIARRGMLDSPGTEPEFDGEYRAEVVTAQGFRESEPVYQVVWSGTAADLRAGRNVIAIGNYNSRPTSSDLYLSARLNLGSARTDDAATPGAPSSLGFSTVPPLVASADHDPAEPTSADAVRILSRIEGPDVDSVEVITDAGDGTEVVAMRDDGAGPDDVAGDGIYSALLPPRPDQTLVRYRIEARAGRSECPASFPPQGNPSPFTGYLVADDRPATAGEVHLFHISTPGALRDLSCADGAWTGGTLVDHRGRAHFDVGVKFRGATACNYPKKPLRVRFNKGDLLDGKSRLNFNAGWNDKGMLREKLTYDFFRDAGVPYSETHMARVHTNGGAFHGVFFTIEDPSTEYLRRNDWDDDAPLYKCFTAMLNGSTAGYEPRTRSAEERITEIGAFASELNSTSGAALIEFLGERLHVEAMIDYQVVQAVVIDLDSVTKNWLLYLGPHGRGKTGPDRVAVFAWDLDLTWGQRRLTTDVRSHIEHPLLHTQTYPFTDQGHHGIVNALLQRAPDDYFVRAHYGRMWNLLQEKFHPDVLLPKIDRYGIATLPHVEDDSEKWPRTWGARGDDPEFWREDLRAWAVRRFEYLTEFLTSDRPTTQGRRFRYAPAPRIKFSEIHYNPEGNSEELEFVELRSLEASAIDISGWTIPAIEFTFPAGSEIAAEGFVIVARNPAALRSAVAVADDLPVFGPYAGNLRNGGEELRLRDGGDARERPDFPETIDVVRYDDAAPWPEAADGDGFSLELETLELDNDLATSWRSSRERGGSPGSLERTSAAPEIVLTVDPVTGVAPLRVAFDASQSRDPSGGELTFAWDFGDGIAGAGAAVSRTYRNPGTYRGSVTATGAAGNATREFEVVVLSDEAPVISLRVVPLSGPAPLEVRGDAAGSVSPRGRELSFAWDFGDGIVGAGADVAHTYREPGRYTGRLTASDGELESTKSFEVVVESGIVLFHRGDANEDGGVNLADGVYVLNFLFGDGPEPACREAANANDDRSLDVADPIFLFNFLFGDGDPIPSPGPASLPCGSDPPESPANLGCEVYEGCRNPDAEAR